MKRLYRSRDDQMLAGVAAGMAKYFIVDPTLIRLLWILAGFAGFGVMGYIIAAIIIPEEPDPNAPVEAPSEPPAGTGSQAPSGNRTIGWLLIIFGALFLIKQVVPNAIWNRMWPFALILVGFYLILDRGRSV